MSAYSDAEPIRVLAQDLGFWLPYLELVVRDRVRGLGRVEPKAADLEAFHAAESPEDVRPAMPCFGGRLWQGEAEAREVARDVVARADENGSLSAIFDAIRRHRVVDDFSARWSYEREDFERKLYRKRSAVKMSFVEVDDSLPVFDENSELHENELWRDLFAIVDQRDQRVVVCLSRAVTRVSEIARELGYANHSPVSKRLARIRRRVEQELGIRPRRADGGRTSSS